MTGASLTPIGRLSGRDGTGVPLGMFVTSTDPAVSEIAGHAGLDFVLIDTEHGPLDRIAVLNHARAASAAGVVSLVRLLDQAPTSIQAALDLGVAGVVLPKIETAEQALRAVASARYAPHGLRGMCPACRDGQYTLDGFTDRMIKRNHDVLVIPIIETQRGVANIAEIAAVDGIDIVHFGPGDLSADMGLDLSRDRDQLEDAWRRVLDVSHGLGKTVLVPAGYEGGDAYIAPMDLILLHNTLRDMVAGVRASGWLV